MNKTPHRAALAAAAASARQHVALRSALVPSGDKVDVNEETGVIKNAAVMQVGPARGHGFSIDAVTLGQVEALGNAQAGGVRIRFKHPDDPYADDLGDVIGFVDNLRVVGDTLRGDVHIEEYAAKLPGRGDVRSYLLGRAKSAPGTLGLSCVIAYDADPVTDSAGNVTSVVARVIELDAIDIVGRGAATPNGLLSAGPSNTGPIDMNPSLKQLLCQMGLDYDASDEAAQAFFDALSEQDKTDLQSRLNAIAAAAQVEADQAASEATAGMSAGGQLNRKETTPMNPELKKAILAQLGLKADTTDEVAQQKYDALSADDKANVDAKAKPETAELGAKPPTRTAVITDDGDKLLAMEGKRVAQLQQLGNVLNVPADVVKLSIATGDTVIDAKAKFLAHLSEQAKPIHSVRVGEDKNRASLAAAIPDAIMLRASVKCEKPHDRAQQLRSLSLVDMAKQYFVSLGVPHSDVAYMSPARVCDLLGPRRFNQQYPNLAQLAQSSSDFGSILADTINKTLRQAYVEVQKTWPKWCKRALNPDFKTITRAVLSESPSMVSRNEGAEIKYVTLSDSKETYSLVEYVAGIKLTRRAVINDDLDAFGRIPMLQGATAGRLEDDTAYAILTANAALSDTGLLFNNTAVTTAGGHANLTSSGTVLSVASLAVGEAAMMLQKGPKNAAILEIQPKFLLVPIQIKATAMQLINSTVDPAKNNSTNNPYAGKYEVIPSARLSANSTTAWYLAASPQDMIDTVELCFLTDEPEPVSKAETDFDTEDQKYAIRHTVAAKALDFRGLYKNAGA